MVFACGPPVTTICVIDEQSAAPVPGSAALTFTLPATQVTATASPASLATVSTPVSTSETTAA